MCILVKKGEHLAAVVIQEGRDARNGKRYIDSRGIRRSIDRTRWWIEYWGLRMEACKK